MKEDATSAASASARDENAVNREIATLLLNLHSSRGGDSAQTAAAAAKLEPT